MAKFYRIRANFAGAGPPGIHMTMCLVRRSVWAALVTSICSAAGAPPELVVQMGHTDAVWSASISADKKFILTGGGDHLAILWDATTGHEIRAFSTKAEIRASAFAPDGRSLLIASGDGEVCLFDLLSGTKQRCYVGHTNVVASLVYSLDGKLLATGARDGTARVWDAATGRELRRITEEGSFFDSIALTPDDKNLVITEGNIHFWSIATGREVKVIKGVDSLTKAAISPDGRFILAGAQNLNKDPREYSVRLLDITGKELRKMPHSDTIGDVQFSRDGRFLLSSDWNGIACIWDASSGRQLHVLKGHGSKPVDSVSFSADGQWALTGSRDGTAVLWDAASGRLIRRLEGYAVRMNAVAVSPDGHYIASGGEDKIAHVWDTRTGQEIRKFQTASYAVGALAFSPDSMRLLAGEREAFENRECSAYLWDVASGKLLRRLDGHDTDVSSVAFSPDGKRMATANGIGGQVYIWDAITGAKLKTLASSWERIDVESVMFSPDGTQILTGNGTDQFQIWNVATGEKIRGVRTGNSRSERTYSAAFSPSGDRVLTGGSDHILRLWDANTGKLLRRMEGGERTTSISAVRFSADGKTALSMAWDGAHAWDLATSKEIGTFEGHTTQVTSGVFSPNGKFVITASFDGTVRVWKFSTGREVCRLISMRDGTSVAIAGDFFDASDHGRSAHLLWRENGSARMVPLDAHAQDAFRPGLLASVWSTSGAAR